MHHCSGKRSMEEAKQNQFDIKKSANREYKKASKKLSTPSYYHDNDDGQQHTLLYMEKKKKGRSMLDDDHHHQQQPSFQLLSKKVITPSHQEIQDNARSRSAKLRSAQRTSSVPLLPFGPLIDDDSDDDV